MFPQESHTLIINLFVNRRLYMPYKIEKREGKRPYKIIKTDTGEVVGSSITLANAKASIRARYMSENKKSK